LDGRWKKKKNRETQDRRRSEKGGIGKGLDGKGEKEGFEVEMEICGNVKGMEGKRRTEEWKWREWKIRVEERRPGIGLKRCFGRKKVGRF
jgi:hypothetical protein